MSLVVEAACQARLAAVSNAALQALAAIGTSFPELAFTHSMEVTVSLQHGLIGHC